MRKIHVLGKNVWKFHTVYWPALLLSAGLPLPDELVIHGFLTANGRKIGKSTGNAISPDAYIQRYGADAVRYFLLIPTARNFWTLSIVILSAAKNPAGRSPAWLPLDSSLRCE